MVACILEYSWASPKEIMTKYCPHKLCRIINIVAFQFKMSYFSAERLKVILRIVLHNVKLNLNITHIIPISKHTLRTNNDIYTSTSFYCKFFTLKALLKITLIFLSHAGYCFFTNAY